MHWTAGTHVLYVPSPSAELAQATPCQDWLKLRQTLASCCRFHAKPDDELRLLLPFPGQSEVRRVYGDKHNFLIPHHFGFGHQFFQRVLIGSRLMWVGGFHILIYGTRMKQILQWQPLSGSSTAKGLKTPSDLQIPAPPSCPVPQTWRVLRLTWGRAWRDHFFRPSKRRLNGKLRFEKKLVWRQVFGRTSAKQWAN
jgi:hypothetical protein